MAGGEEGVKEEWEELERMGGQGRAGEERKVGRDKMIMGLAVVICGSLSDIYKTAPIICIIC